MYRMLKMTASQAGFSLTFRPLLDWVTTQILLENILSESIVRASDGDLGGEVLLRRMTGTGGPRGAVGQNLLLELLVQFRLERAGEEGLSADNGGGLVAAGEDRGGDGLEAVRGDSYDAGGQLDYPGFALGLSLSLAVKLVPNLLPLEG